MSIVKFIWKVWLRLNLLTKDVENDYVAEVSTAGKSSLRNADIAQAIKDEGSEFQYETLLNILDHADRIARRRIQEGYSVQTGNCRMSPRISGVWPGASAKFDPDANRVTLDIVPTAEMREALREVGVEVLGVKDGGAFIGLVTDAATGATDGTVTAGDDVIIEGDKLRVAPDGEAGIGIFFVNEAWEAVPVTHRLTQNDPKRIIARVPILAPGQYTLRVVTRFSTGAKTLKEPRTIEYDRPLIVG